jgi:hypothetical protein
MGEMRLADSLARPGHERIPEGDVVRLIDELPIDNDW